ncbi:molybdenum cofactor guanylyltransferase MobA [Klebsiella sp. BIGb0407]|uniref:molybdenum cofactor guanylyltransferase MobA n=1 Tax=Klebsiella sp. BIGb0407 TaxID=2940603 RepID=UPI002166F1E1|nr:molybdenum cofactor guanylyltransferase MobA [Klebsiella sp. BIGb0407]MCS3434091.1 molybdopterin-guanine dinucleotide biosynthesis protein A [Klebsiella sp. BIGb0407]
MQRLVKITGVVLAGGQGSRMGGKDKGLVLLNGIALFRYVLETLRPQVNQLVISANRHIDIYQQAGVPVIADSLPDYPGPLAGMLAVMETIESEWFLFSPCDTPNIPSDLAYSLWDGLGDPAISAVWVNDGERDHPGIALIHHSAKVALRAYLSAGERRVMQFLRSIGGRAVVFDSSLTDFANINTLDELSNWQESEK